MMSRATASKWFQQARHDLRIAEGLIGIRGYDTAAFLAHQAVEKLLKAILFVRGRSAPRTHHVDDLARELGLPSDVVDRIAELDVDYMMSRYPDISDSAPFEIYSEATARHKLSIAHAIFDALSDETNALTGDAQ